jgi:hypothetical protein
VVYTAGAVYMDAVDHEPSLCRATPVFDVVEEVEELVEASFVPCIMVCTYAIPFVVTVKTVSGSIAAGVEYAFIRHISCSNRQGALRVQ